MTKYAMTSQHTVTFEVTSPFENFSTENNGEMDSPAVSITGQKVNYQNYLPWLQSVMMFICGKGKDNYLTGAAVSPSNEDPRYQAWKAGNKMVMSLLINSMTYEIAENFLLFGSDKEIRDAAK